MKKVDKEVKYKAEYVKPGHQEKLTHESNGAIAWPPSPEPEVFAINAENDALARKKARAIAKKEGLVLMTLKKVTVQTLFTATPSSVITTEVYE